MEKSFLLNRLLPFLIMVAFVWPLIHLLFYVPLKPVAWDPFLLKVMSGAFLQASLSTVVTLVLALLGSVGLVSLFDRLSIKASYLLTIVIMLPSFLPPIVTVILATQAISHYLTGLWGIVFFHGLMNVGIVGYILAKKTQEKAGDWAQLCRVEGVSFASFYIRGVLPGLKRDIFSISTFLFIIFFLSFSIPLLVGDVGYSGVEVFIYEKIFLFGQWNEAIQYCLAFILILYALSFFRDERNSRQNLTFQKSKRSWPYKVSFMNLFLVIPTLLLCVGFFKSVIFWAFNFSVPWMALRGTFLTGLITGVFVFLMFSIVAYSSFNQRLSNRLLAFISPSWALIGFSFFLMGSQEVSWSILKVGLALTLIYVPYLHRFSFFNKLKELKPQTDVALVSGASWNRTFFVVLWPQLIPMICLLSGIAALWASGDFALTGMLLADETTLALQMKNLMMNYRLEQAMLILVPLVTVSVIIFSIFQGLGYVCRRSFLS